MDNNELSKKFYDTCYRLFNTDDGKFVLDILLKHHVYTPSYFHNMTSIDLAYFIGKADIVKSLYINSLTK